MRVNVNHPSFITFLDNVSNSILSNVTIENYFSLPQDKKMGIQYMVLKLMKNSVKVRAKLTDSDLRSFIVVLWKKNEEYENYEFASVLKDISNNFESINDLSKPPVKKQTKQTKIDNKK